jgi:hypothetical protein
LVITEIFADPTPSKGLPEIEFIEIKNVSEKDINLNGYVLKYGNFSTAFPDSVIYKTQTILVCRKTNEALLRPYGRTIGVSNFSLNNEGSLLVIFNDKKEIETWVNYDKSWYTNNKEDGYSLEMIDLRYPCRGKENWGSSNSPLGATPGKTNSLEKINPDTEVPIFVSYSIENDKINLMFNENLALSFISDKQNFKVFDTNLTLKDISYDQFKPNDLWLNIDRNIEVNQTLKVGISNLSDCSGNMLDYYEIEIANVPSPDSGQILISEVLFNPKIGSDDFVEIKNTSDKSLNIKGVKLANLNKEGNLESVSLLSSRDLVLKPDSYMAFTINKSSLIGVYPLSSEPSSILEVPKMPSLNNDKGNVVLISNNDQVFDSMEYEEKMHHSAIKNPDGVSLERVEFKVPSTQTSNWMSGSASNNYASPGKRNSQQTTEKILNEFWVESNVFLPRSNDNSLAKLNYSIPIPGTTANIFVRNKDGKVCKSIIKNSILGTQGQIFWDGTDDSGILLPVGYYVFEVQLFSEKNSNNYLIKIVLGEI